LSYQPNKNTNIGKIYSIIPSDRSITQTQLKTILAKKWPEIPFDSVYVHFKFLAKKGLIVIQKEKDVTSYIRTSNEQTTMEFKKGKENRGSKQQQLLDYVKQYVGKRISTQQVVLTCGRNLRDNGPRDMLKRLEDSGFIQRIEGTLPIEYLVLPDIKGIDKIPTKRQIKETQPKSVITKQSVPIETNDLQQKIANMTMSEILESFIELKQENLRMKEALQRMGMEFIQLGVLEHD
jgi:Fe2+ or Zn2+ uptake regulation protein